MGKANGYWKRHQKKELQDVLLEFHAQGWRILDPPKYYKAYCVCGLGHKTTIHLTPSDPRYALNKLRWLQRQQCYGEKGA